MCLSIQLPGHTGTIPGCPTCPPQTMCLSIPCTTVKHCMWVEEVRCVKMGRGLGYRHLRFKCTWCFGGCGGTCETFNSERTNVQTLYRGVDLALWHCMHRQQGHLQRHRHKMQRQRLRSLALVEPAYFMGRNYNSLADRWCTLSNPRIDGAH